MLGVVGAFGLLDGIDDALASADRSGQFWHADVLPGEGVSIDELVGGLSAEERVSDIHVVSLSDVDLDGASAPVYTLESRRGSRKFTLLEGRRPAAADEIAMGPATAKALRKRIGDTVHAAGAHSASCGWSAPACCRRRHTSPSTRAGG